MMRLVVDDQQITRARHVTEHIPDISYIALSSLWQMSRLRPWADSRVRARNLNNFKRDRGFVRVLAEIGRRSPRMGALGPSLDVLACLFSTLQG